MTLPRLFNGFVLVKGDYIISVPSACSRTGGGNKDRDGGEVWAEGKGEK